jgi:hypothetical protein
MYRIKHTYVYIHTHTHIHTHIHTVQYLHSFRHSLEVLVSPLSIGKIFYVQHPSANENLANTVSSRQIRKRERKKDGWMDGWTDRPAGRQTDSHICTFSHTDFRSTNFSSIYRLDFQWLYIKL